MTNIQTSGYTNYAQFNTMTVTGRITNAEIKSGKNGEFLSVSLIHVLQKDADEVTITFTDNGKLLENFKKGFLDRGRLVTLTGRLFKVSEVYVDKDGQYQMRKRPEMKLTDVIIVNGGYGPKPQDRAAVTPANAVKQMNRQPAAPVAQDAAPVDEAPAFDWA